ncbi:hypothetical protein JXB37_01320, partial [candidate division WOR-3 bacterium]|nr:hypothetical protein [candidate division WOR-3 bacterium]
MLAALACGLALAGPVDWQPRANGLDIEVRVPAVVVGPAATDGYSSVVLDGAGYIDAIGAPMVPVYRELIEVPYGAEVVLETEAAGVETERLELPLLPRQAPVPKSGPLSGFALDEKAYSRDEFGPVIGARIAGDVISRGHRLVLVEVFPVSYNPETQELRVARDLVVRVRWTGADYGRTAERQERYDSPVFENRLRGVVLNE